MSVQEAVPLPPTYKGLLFTSPSEPPTVTTFPTPAAEPGSIIVRPLYSGVVSYANEVYANGNPRGYSVPFPVIGGSNAIGRVAAVPADATHLRVGDLVTVEPLVRARDRPEDHKLLLAFLGGFSPEASRLAREVWRHGTWAELVKVPLENVLRFDEAALRRHGVSVRDLGVFGQLALPYGGLRDVHLTAGETVIIAPATGNFGGAGVHVALAMGARVIAMGRNKTILKELEALAPGRVHTVTLSGSVETDTDALSKFGPADVFMDFTPTGVSNTSHVTAGMMSVRAGGRISFMGGLMELSIPYGMIAARGITVKGTMMYTRAQAQDLIKLVETGTLKLGEKAGLKTLGVFKMDDGIKALESAHQESGAGRAVLVAPNEDTGL
ncbi:alcohol dehydrogenase GroES domain-containing protein [Xylariaceae sp. FL0016]|nr:alcohol dehydrogenase GroES domain-containing protein [Xylariaceae sp. FL0016]